MREIKFRGFSKEYNKMFNYKEMKDASDGMYKICDRELKRIDANCNYLKKGLYLPTEDKDLILMQYTGLKDINGIEIYEGDILEYTFDGVTKRDVIVYEGNMFTYRNAIRWNLQSDKVIGNIYENSELLEER